MERREDDTERKEVGTRERVNEKGCSSWKLQSVNFNKQCHWEW